MKEGVIQVFIAMGVIVLAIIWSDIAIHKIREIRCKKKNDRYNEFVSSMKIKGVKYNPDGSYEEIGK